MRTKKKMISDLSSLRPEQREQLCDWLLSGLSFEKARQLAEKEFGLVVESNEPMEMFWQKYCTPALLARRSRAAAMASEIAAEAAKGDEHFQKAALDALKQKTFELMLSPQLDVKMLRHVISFVVKMRDQELAQFRLNLMEKKLERAAQVEDTVKDDSLSAMERDRRLKEIFCL